MNTQEFKELQERAAELVDMKTDLVRCIFTDCQLPSEYRPHGEISKARTESQGWSKGQMIADIIKVEFHHTTT